jgi:DNA helicase-2/ATP-dependent DNA helicase PcrA
MFQHDADLVHAGTEAGGYGFSDIAVLYRLRAQAQPLRKVFEASGIPYRGLSMERITECPAARPFLFLLRGLANPGDQTAMLGVALECVKGRKRNQEAVQCIEDTLGRLAQERESDSIADLILSLTQRFELDQDISQRLSRLASPYDGRPWTSCLSDFLQDLTLGRQTDLYDSRSHAVTLMTTHAAKGLEFPVVFVAGLDKGLMPYARGQDPSQDEIEEERRLFHVAMTRAMKELYLLHARSRRVHGAFLAGEPSPFLTEMAQALYCKQTLKKPKGTRRPEDAQPSLF